MKAKGRFICALLVIDTFFGAFYVGFNSRSVLVVNPKLPPLVPKAEAKATTGETKSKTGESKAKAQSNKPASHPTTAAVKVKAVKAASKKPHKNK